MNEQNQTPNPAPTASGSGLAKVIGGVVVLIILVVAGFYFLRSKQEHPASEQTPTSESSIPSNNQSPGGKTAGAVEEFTISNNGLRFSPNQIKVKRGDTVKVTFNNTG